MSQCMSMSMACLNIWVGRPWNGSDGPCTVHFLENLMIFKLLEVFQWKPSNLRVWVRPDWVSDLAKCSSTAAGTMIGRNEELIKVV